MTVQELIQQLQHLPIQDAQVYITTSDRCTEVKGIDSLVSIILAKSNNEGTYDAYLIYPNKEVKTTGDEEESPQE